MEDPVTPENFAHGIVYKRLFVQAFAGAYLAGFDPSQMKVWMHEGARVARRLVELHDKAFKGMLTGELAEVTFAEGLIEHCSEDWEQLVANVAMVPEVQSIQVQSAMEGVEDFLEETLG